MKNKIKYIVLAVVVVLLTSFIFNSIKSSSQKSIENNAPVLQKIRIAYNITNLDTVPLIIALQRGYFRNKGISIELTPVTGSDGAIAASSGQVDMVIVGAPRLYGPIDKGAPIKILSPMSNTYSEVMVRPNSGIKTLKDLEGKKLSFGPAGGAKELFLKNILKNENININKINFVTVDNAYLPVALMDKKAIDIALISDANFVDQATKLGGVILPEWQEKNYHQLSTGLVVAVNTDFLNTHEELVKNFFTAIIEANRYLKSNLDEAAEMVADYFKEKTNGAMAVDPENFKKLVISGQVTYDLWGDPTPIVQMAGISFELGQIKRNLTQDDLYDLRFKSLLELAQNEIYGSVKN